MCGIAGGAWAPGTNPIDPQIVRRMTDVLVHRGPDDGGLYDSRVANLPQGSAGAVLGQRRLSIIDLGGGHQPLANEDESIWITFNGEIYNYREIQTGLKQRGHTLRTDSDTEAIVHLYEDYGIDCVRELRGMFAFAIWDARKQQLFIARDRLGKKPLVYRHDGGNLWFASELKSLLQIPNAPRSIDPRAVDYFLNYQYVPHPFSILEGYHKLPPAHRLLFKDNTITVDRYWAPPYADDAPTTPGVPRNFKNYEEGKQQLRDTLTEAVRLRMRSDVPLGAFLSGGIDSTIICGLMQKLSTRPVKTFSIGFPVKSFDEREYARLAATHLGTEHHEQVVEPSALQILPKLIWHYDEPFADSSAIPCLYLAEMTRKHVTVSLSGDGGDELFAGYRRYQAVRISGWLDHLPGFIRRSLGSNLVQKIPTPVAQYSKLRRIKKLCSALAEPPERRYLKWVSILDAERRRELYHPDFAARLHNADAADFLLDAYRECPNRDFITRTTCVDVLTYLPCDILTKVDIASMAYSLESRNPFLDHHVVELAARMPIDWKLSGNVSKKILIETFAEFLPPQIQNRSKMGFGVPLDHWFRHELRDMVHDLLLDDRTLNRGYFHPAEVRRLVSEHEAKIWDHSHRIWSLLVLELWHRTFLDPSTPPTA